MINLEAKHQIDVAAIASCVGQALDPVPQFARPEPPNADIPLPMLDELNRQVRQLASDLERYYSLQQRLEQQLVALRQQVHLLPGHIVRLEQWSAGVDFRLASLEPIVLEPAVAEPHAGQDRTGRWLSVKEAACRLGVKASTIRRYVHQGKLRATRLPGGRDLRVFWPDGCAFQAAEAGPGREP